MSKKKYRFNNCTKADLDRMIKDKKRLNTDYDGDKVELVASVSEVPVKNKFVVRPKLRNIEFIWALGKKVF